MLFRDATAADAEAIARLHAESWRSAYRGTFSDEFLDTQVHEERRAAWLARFSPAETRPFFVLMTESDTEMAGFACVFPDEHPVYGSYLDNLHVAPQLTGRGIGRYLLCEVARRLAGNTSRIGLYLWVVERNRRARVFYERAGGVIMGSEVHCMSDGQDVVALRCYWPDLRKLLL
jgi:GNAT superfamily N-acetyltransferase